MKLLSRPTKATLRWIFVGRGGIRAGWSVLIFFAVIAACAVGLHFIVHHGMPKTSDTVAPRFLLIFEVVTLVVTLFATAVMGLIERRPFWSYGLAGRRAGVNFVSGLAGGMFCLSLLLGALYAGGYLTFGGLALHGLPILKYGVAWLLVFVLVGCSEEALFRGYLQATLTRGMGFWPAALVLSLSFGAAHYANSGETLAGLAGVVVFGLVFCLLLWLSGSLWLGIGFHAAWDWAQSYFYGTPDSGMLMRGHLLITHAIGNVRISGGSAGPEASALLVPALAVGLAAFLLLLRRAGLLQKKAVVF